MGLKDQLIQKMNDEKNGGSSEEEVVVEEIEDTLDESTLFSDDNGDDEPEDLSGLFDDEEVIEVPADDEPIFDEEDIEEPEPEPTQRKKKPRKERPKPKAPEPEPEPEYYEEDGEYYDDEPNFYEEETTFISNVDNSALEASLLSKAKETILNDIKENYHSEMFTSPLIGKLIDSYFSNKDSGLSNSDAIFTSVIDEIISSDYIHDYYGELVEDILESVKKDIN